MSSAQYGVCTTGALMESYMFKLISVSTKGWYEGTFYGDFSIMKILKPIEQGYLVNGFFSQN